MAEFNAQHWQSNNVGAYSHDHLSSFMGMGMGGSSNNSIQINAAAPPGMMTLDNKSGTGSGVSSDDHHHHHDFQLDHSFFALLHHYHPQALASTPIVEAPSPAAGIPSSSLLKVNEKESSSIRRSRKKASDKDEVVRVRARKGQASDSHSAAERVRREKINKKLRCLQELVPGCHKSMGMAVMLEEIINYVYSLQNQVEFLSMELATAAAANSSRSISRPSLQGKNVDGREDYGDATTYFHSTATASTSTTWSI